MRIAALIFTAAIGLGAAPAFADVVPNTSTYSFSGTCSDCTGTASAELVLQNYTPGDTIDSTNFVSFHYDGTDLLGAFTIAQPDASTLSGSMMPPLPGSEDFYVMGNDEVFSSSAKGYWCAGEDCFLDNGQAHLWSLAATPTAVPEPFGLSLLAAPLLGLAMLRRR